MWRSSAILRSEMYKRTQNIDSNFTIEAYILLWCNRWAVYHRALLWHIGGTNVFEYWLVKFIQITLWFRLLDTVLFICSYLTHWKGVCVCECFKLANGGAVGNQWKRWAVENHVYRGVCTSTVWYFGKGNNYLPTHAIVLKNLCKNDICN